MEDALLEQVYDLAKMGPTSANMCPMRIILVKSREAKERLKPALDAVVGIPHPHWGERPKAFVTLNEGAAATPQEIITFCRDRLAHYKAPKRIEFGPLPKTGTGKIQKFVLRDRVRAGQADQRSIGRRRAAASRSGLSSVCRVHRRRGVDGTRVTAKALTGSPHVIALWWIAVGLGGATVALGVGYVYLTPSTH